MVRVGDLVLFGFLLGASLADLPAFATGTEVRVVSPDLLTLYSSGRVENDLLMIDLPLDVGTEVRLLVFGPDDDDDEIALALAGGTALYAHVAQDRADILLRIGDLDEPLSLRAWLLEEHGITLVMITRRTR
ncbi:MAG: hypothetical protein EA416_09260 [Trueperaceae bacterium]|nr:MAG: hypothetical protein EA416_09260 [Trueperaceae bacterium]